LKLIGEEPYIPDSTYVIIDATYNGSETKCQIEVRRTGTYHINATSPYIKYSVTGGGLTSTLTVYHKGEIQTTDVSYVFNPSVSADLRSNCNIDDNGNGAAVVSLNHTQPINAIVEIDCVINSKVVDTVEISAVTDDYYSLTASKTILESSIPGDNLRLYSQVNGTALPPETNLEYSIEDKNVLKYVALNKNDGAIGVIAQADTTVEFTVYGTVNRVKVASIELVLMAADTYSHTLSKAFLSSLRDSTEVNVYKNGEQVTSAVSLTCKTTNYDQYIEIKNNKITQKGSPKASNIMTFDIDISVNNKNVDSFKLDVINPYPNYVRNDDGSN
jgi:hypothetical protein